MHRLTFYLIRMILFLLESIDLLCFLFLICLEEEIGLRNLLKSNLAHLLWLIRLSGIFILFLWEQGCFVLLWLHFCLLELKNLAKSKFLSRRILTKNNLSLASLTSLILMTYSMETASKINNKPKKTIFDKKKTT